jgi:hypothetical protein
MKKITQQRFNKCRVCGKTNKKGVAGFGLCEAHYMIFYRGLEENRIKLQKRLSDLDKIEKAVYGSLPGIGKSIYHDCGRRLQFIGQEHICLKELK